MTQTKRQTNEVEHRSAGTKETKNIYNSEHPITELVLQKIQGSANNCYNLQF